MCVSFVTLIIMCSIAMAYFVLFTQALYILYTYINCVLLAHEAIMDSPNGKALRGPTFQCAILPHKCTL